jgi:hypothetical protein
LIDVFARGSGGAFMTGLPNCQMASVAFWVRAGDFAYSLCVPIFGYENPICGVVTAM